MSSMASSTMLVPMAMSRMSEATRTYLWSRWRRGAPADHRGQIVVTEIAGAPAPGPLLGLAGGGSRCASWPSLGTVAGAEFGAVVVNYLAPVAVAEAKADRPRRSSSAIVPAIVAPLVVAIP